MASGSVKHLGFTLCSTGAEGITAKQQEAASEGEDDKLASKKFTKLTRAAYEKGQGASAINAKLFFGRKLFDQSLRDTNAERRAAAKSPTLKVGDAHADWFASKKDGGAMMADVGAEVVRLDSRRATIGIGPRVDTGVDYGKRGARCAFFWRRRTGDPLAQRGRHGARTQALRGVWVRVFDHQGQVSVGRG
mmetsp:Transcript_79705/g.238803  ORF Transcript_79705/g.238803 Transcript_79705/m.238803 type:complete len:191 (+) Transcript_79705:126-698(+)